MDGTFADSNPALWSAIQPQFPPQSTTYDRNKDRGVANFVYVSVHLRETGSLRVRKEGGLPS